MTRDDLVHKVTMAVSTVATHEGTALGAGGDLDELSEAVVVLGQASRGDFETRSGAANRALHVAWTRRVGKPGYKKPLWMDIDRALTYLVSHIETEDMT